jgi:hypothetical protein
VDDFWRDNAALLETPDRACPAAVARWPAAQARIVAEIETRQPQFTAALRRSARRP